MKPKQRQDIARVLLAAARNLAWDKDFAELGGQGREYATGGEVVYNVDVRKLWQAVTSSEDARWGVGKGFLYFEDAERKLRKFKDKITESVILGASGLDEDEIDIDAELDAKWHAKSLAYWYGEIVVAGDEIPPVELDETGHLLDGYHRLVVAVVRGVSSLPAVTVTGSKEPVTKLLASRSKLSTLYHVGRLDQPRRKPAVSYEGSGLSVSLHPDEWRKIARGQVGGDTWELTREDPKFLMATAANKKKAVDWAVANGWIAQRKRYRVSWFDDEMDDTMSTEFDSLAEAQEEADAYGVEPEEVDSFVLDKKGKAYWKQAFSSKPSNSLANDFAIIWFAEANGYDGVWWNEKLDPDRLSAPRGVILQGKLPEWSKRKLSHD